MGKKKQSTTTVNNYQEFKRTDTPDIVAARNLAQNADFHTPVVNAYGQAENLVNNQSFEDALPEGERGRIRLSQMFNLQQAKGAALGQAAAQEHAAKTGAQMSLAGMTQSPILNMGGTQNTTMSDGGWGIANMAMQGAGMGLSM